MQDQKRARPAPLDPYRIVRIPATVYPPAAGIVGGLAGGLGMIPFAAAYGWMSGHGLWYPVNLVASTIIRDWQHATQAQLEKPSAEGILVAVLIHLIMSMGLGLSFAVLLPALPGNPLVWAGIVGPLLWFGAVFAGLPLFNPVMAQRVDWASFGLANIAYSLILGAWVARTHKVPAE